MTLIIFSNIFSICFDQSEGKRGIAAVVLFADVMEEC